MVDKTQLDEYTYKEATYLDKYLAQLNGATILAASVRYDPDDRKLWPTFEVILADGTEANIEISQDAEGNGPGFVFGLNADV